ncbi:hypothetical protein ABKA04_000050 [Annulohypoxylon sp. FPYF3050]
MCEAGMECAVFDPSEQDKPDYTRWSVMVDGSLTKNHIQDGFLELVTPVLIADDMWTKTIDSFWCILHQYFELRQDSTCGTHVHISFREGHFSIGQLRNMAKAVTY